MILPWIESEENSSKSGKFANFGYKKKTYNQFFILNVSNQLSSSSTIYKQQLTIFLFLDYFTVIRLLN